jgi:hypothetical protein
LQSVEMPPKGYPRRLIAFSGRQLLPFSLVRIC